MNLTNLTSKLIVAIVAIILWFPQCSKKTTTTTRQHASQRISTGFVPLKKRIDSARLECAIQGVRVDRELWDIENKKARRIHYVQPHGEYHYNQNTQK